jgi:hypothetical protein
MSFLAIGGTNVAFLAIGGTYVDLIEGGTNVGGTNVGRTNVGGRKVAASSRKCRRRKENVFMLHAVKYIIGHRLVLYFL